MNETINAVSSCANFLETRVKAVADLYSSRKSAASAAGVSTDMLTRYMRGESQPSFAAMAGLCVPVGVSLDWLASGKGDMLPLSEQGLPSTEVAPAEGLENDYVYVPLYDAICSAGHGAWNESCAVLTSLAFTRYSLTKKGLHVKDLSAIRVAGDSMEPTLKDGDAVLIDHSHNRIGGEGIYVIWMDDHLYAKRLQKQYDGSLKIISENRTYSPMDVPKERVDEINVIGLVVWSCGWMI